MSLETKKSWTGFLFVLPFIIGFVFFFLSPFILYITMAVSSMNLTNTGMNFTLVGLENFKSMLINYPNYTKDVLNSVRTVFSNVISVVLYSFFVALIINQKFKGRFLVRAIFFMPVLTASGMAAVSGNPGYIVNIGQAIVQGLTGSNFQTTNYTVSVIRLFGNFQVSRNLLDIVSATINNMYNIVNSSGVQILIFLAGLQTISPSLYEASKIDGATPWENFWKITLPMLSPIILVNSVYTVIDYMTSANNDVINFIYNIAIGQTKYCLSSAMGLLYFAVVFAIIGITLFIVSRFVYYEN